MEKKLEEEHGGKWKKKMKTNLNADGDKNRKKLKAEDGRKKENAAGISITTDHPPSLVQWGRYCSGQLIPEIGHFSVILSVGLCP